MNLLEMLKQANIFSPTGQMSNQQFPVGSIGGPIDSSVQSTPQSQGIDLMSAIQDLLSPKDQQFQNYAQMINQMPQRQDYQPDLLRRIGATLAGMGTGSPVGISGGAVLGYKSNIPEGLKVQQAINEEPYSKALTDWANKLEPTGKIAQMEQTRNVGNRATGLGVLQKQQNEEKIAETERKNRALEEDRDLDRKVRELRASVYQYKAEHPNSTVHEDSEGYLISVNPATNEVEYLSDPEGNRIKSSKLPDADRINLQMKGELQKIDTRAQKSKELEGQRQANRKELEGQRQINRLDLKTTPAPTRPSNSIAGTTPSAQATAKINKAIDIISQHPELKPYFVYGGNKKPTGELVPNPKDPNDAGFTIAQRLMAQSGDINLPSSGKISPEVTPEPQSRELTRPAEDAKLKAARAKVEPGYVLITDGKSFGQVKPADIDKLPKGWMVVK